MWQCNAHKVSLELTSERIRHYLATKNSEAWLKGDWNVCNPIHLRLLSTVGLFSLASGWVRRASPVLRELLGAHDYGTIAAKLNEEGFRTAKGYAYNAAIVGALVRARGWGRKQVEQGTGAEGKS